MGCASSIHISDRVVYQSGKESDDSQQTNTTPAPGLLIKPNAIKVRHTQATLLGEHTHTQSLLLTHV